MTEKGQGSGLPGEIVLYIRWDPRKSHLPMEGLRIASGLTVGNCKLKVCLNRQATLLLSLPSEEIIDGEERDSYLDILKRNKAGFYYEGVLPEVDCAVESRPITGVEKEKHLSDADRLIII